MRTQPYLPPATRAVKGNHRSGWGLAQLHGNQRWSVPLDVPRHFLPAAPMGCDGPPGIPRFQRSAYGWAEVSLSHTADHRPAGCRPAGSECPSRSSPWGDLGGTSGLALAPHLAVGMDWMKCVFGCQGSGKDFPVGKFSEKALLSISHGKAHCSWPFFSFFKKLFQLRIYPLQPARYCGTLHPFCLSDFRLLFLQEVDPPQQILLCLSQGGYRLF